LSLVVSRALEVAMAEVDTQTDEKLAAELAALLSPSDEDSIEWDEDKVLEITAARCPKQD